GRRPTTRTAAFLFFCRGADPPRLISVSSGFPGMPRLSANLGFLWPDRPLLQRIEAASRAGFGVVEFHLPFEVSPDVLRETCARQGVNPLNINAAPGRRPGDFGLAAVAGRGEDFAALLQHAV